MSELEIIRVDGKGDPKEEVLKLRVKEDIPDLSEFLVYDNTFKSSGETSNEFRHLYRFPRLRVKKGEYVWLYTKPGRDMSRGNDSKTTTYELYWGANHSIWNKEGDVAHLIKLSSAVSKAV